MTFHEQPELDLVETLCGLARALRVTREADRRAAPGLDEGHLALLIDLHAGPRRIGDVAEMGNHELSTVSRRISRLVERGLVEKVAQDGDRRVQVATLTEAGRQTLKDVHDQRLELLEQAVSGWQSDEVATLHRLARRLTDQLNEPLEIRP
ncbi:MarR family winged helix-turn-helix transcriptional regulator [Luteococcus sp. Sow4_B9]|uniref:MarR family winged helix-turn-helix transcriptional regulator n=1 Tax=Luteococcus sp. Sow4_B9 TaxID=3438792 RepID=UPI003F9C44DA